MSLRLRLISSIILYGIVCMESAYAFQSMDARSSTHEQTPSDISEFFAPYETNSFMFKSTSGDNSATEINVSMRYYFKEQYESEKNGQKKMTRRASLLGFNPFFSYTGKHDFYWTLSGNTRPSAPVISRYHNPALHFRWLFPDGQFTSTGDWFDGGIEHISNGQAVTAKDNQAALIAAYQTNNTSVMDSISRVGALVGLTFEGHKKIDNDSDLFIKWYAYRYSQESDIYWGPYANKGEDFSGFQILRIQWRRQFDGYNIMELTSLPWQFSVEMNMGSHGLSTDSWNFLLNTPLKILGGEFPFAFSAHRGPMNTLSDYTRSQNTFAFGFAFTY